MGPNAGRENPAGVQKGREKKSEPSVHKLREENFSVGGDEVHRASETSGPGCQGAS